MLPSSQKTEITLTYVRSYYRRRPARVTSFHEEDGTTVDLKDPKIKARIDKALPQAKAVKDQWATDFLTSLGEGFQKYGGVTPKQYEWLKKIEKRFDPKVKAAANKWRTSFTDDMREKMRILAQIQKEENKENAVLYWVDLVEKILSDDTFIPTENQYRKFTENKYAEGKLKAYKGKPKFSKGEAVAPVANYGFLYQKKWSVGIVIDIDHKMPTSHAKGAKKYLVLPHGATAAVTVEERDIKKYRAPKKK